jgi:hypothetical protein
VVKSVYDHAGRALVLRGTIFVVDVVLEILIFAELLVEFVVVGSVEEVSGVLVDVELGRVPDFLNTACTYLNDRSIVTLQVVV